MSTLRADFLRNLLSKRTEVAIVGQFIGLIIADQSQLLRGLAVLIRLWEECKGVLAVGRDVLAVGYSCALRTALYPWV
jgi:hypothetical protein